MNALVAPDTDTAHHTSTPDLAHIAGKAGITRGYVHGVPVEALCGARLVPSRDPNRFPTCAECRELAAALAA